jgi:molecular chaperone HtpG
MVERIQNALGETVKEVRISKRLTESPACLVVGDYEMSQNLQRVFAQLGQDAPDVKPILEINPDHALITKMDQEPDEDLFADLAKILFDQALLAEGGQLEDPAAFVRRLNKLMLS